MAVRLEPTPRSSVLQFGLMTVPFLILFLFFLYVAAVRPSDPINSLDTNVDDYIWNSALDESGPQFALMDMMICFLVAFGLFATLAVYILIFIPKRRNLMKSYLEKGQVVLGDVIYEEETNWCNWLTKHAYAVYPHPQKGSSKMIRKQVRVYQHYTREQTTILCLPNKPYSGQPKSDVEFDLAGTAETRDKSRRISWIIIAWLVFSLVGAMFIVHQMNYVYDEDASVGWKVFGFGVGVIVPLVALGGNFLRWLYRRHWLLHAGSVVKTKEQVQENSEEQQPDAPYHSMEAA